MSRSDWGEHEGTSNFLRFPHRNIARGLVTVFVCSSRCPSSKLCLSALSGHAIPKVWKKLGLCFLILRKPWPVRARGDRRFSLRGLFDALGMNLALSKLSVRRFEATNIARADGSAKEIQGVSMESIVINPSTLVRPRGYNHAIKTTGCAAILFLGGQVAWDREGQLVGEHNIVLQFDKALENILTVVREAGGNAQSIVKLNLYVTDKEAYLAAQKELGEIYRRHLGKHFPAMTLVEVNSLYEPGAQVEIEGLAVL